MSWNCTFYYNTNLTSVNTLKDPATLATAQTKTVPALDIISGQNLTRITVKASFSDLENVDFCVLQNGTYTYFYSVEGPATPSSSDVWTVSVNMDAWLTGVYRAGGLNNIEILDGITERHHVTQAEDTFGAYTEPDNLLTPSKELSITETEVFNPRIDTANLIIVESLVKLGDAGTNREAITYTDSTTGAECTVPAPLESEDDSTFCVASWDNTTHDSTEGSAYYDRSNTYVQKGLDAVRRLGNDTGAVLASVKIPNAYVTTSYVDAKGHIGIITGNQWSKVLTGMPYEYATVNNKRVLYGETSAYVVYSVASGHSMQFNPEQLYKSGDTAPTIYMDIDPRVTGSPIFRFKYYKGIDVITNNLFHNAVYGLEWAQAPLVYTGASGSALTEVQYQANTEINKDNLDMSLAQIQLQREQQQRSIGVGILQGAVQQGITGAALGGVGGAIGGAIGGAVGSGIMGAYNYWEGENTRTLQTEQLQQKYQNNANKELLALKIATSYACPSLHFLRSNSMRDYLGNGAYIVRYKPQASDIAKMDKILTMYGYKDTKVLSLSDFDKRSKFSYVKASGVQIGGNLPKWLREAMASQISAGVRVWKQLPDSTVYTDGSNT